MNLLESLRTALEGVWANKLRSGLTMLGIIIGIAAVIAVMAIGQGGQKRIIGEIEKVGVNLFAVFVDHNSEEEFSERDLNVEDAKKLAELSPYIDKMVAESSTVATVKGPNDKKRASLRGTEFDSLAIQSNVEVTKGRFFNEAEDKEGRAVIVLDEELAAGLFGREDPIGKRVQINNSSAVVVGLAKESKFFLDSGQTKPAYVPIRFLMRAFDRVEVSYLQGKAVSKEEVGQAMEQAKRYLNRVHGHKNHYASESLDQVTEQVNKVTGILTLIISLIAGISLLVGGIGVMNIMLVSVTERTREIGIRKALGARRKDILIQFLIESVIICLIGGTIGTLLGIGGATLISYFAKMPPLISWSTVLVAFLFSSAIGIFFGLYPANKAAKLDPIEALRYE